jgi:uncharacterized protein (TIGR00269 family)
LTVRPPACTKCHERDSIYFRPYSGERLCPACFKRSLRERVERTIASFEMLEHDSRVAVGVSGGKDSLGLLHILAEIERGYPQAEIIAVSVDEGVQGYRDEAISIAKEACGNLGVEHLVVSFKELFGLTMDNIAASNRDLGACTYCGVLRRRALNEASLKVEANRLATAHTLDDMAQTALLNVLRGDVNSLSMVDPGGRDLPGFVRRIKPYCEVPERESALYAYLEGFRFQELPCPYAGEAMRNDVRGFLSRMEAKRPGTMFTVYKTAMKLVPERGEATLMGACTVCGEPTKGTVCRACQLIEGLKGRLQGNA